MFYPPVKSVRAQTPLIFFVWMAPARKWPAPLGLSFFTHPNDTINCPYYGLLISCIVVMYSFDHTLTQAGVMDGSNILKIGHEIGKNYYWYSFNASLLMLNWFDFYLSIWLAAIELLRQSFVLIFIFSSLNTIIRANFVDNKSYFLSFSK